MCRHDENILKFFKFQLDGITNYILWSFKTNEFIY